MRYTAVGTRLRGALLAACLVALPISTLSGASVANATDSSYECGSCSTLNSPNNYYDEAGATNYTYSTLELWMWKYNGGSNWNIEDSAFSNGSHVRLCLGANEFYRHAETLEYFTRSAHMSGRIANYKTCQIP
jgi:hypothetical protein